MPMYRVMFIFKFRFLFMFMGLEHGHRHGQMVSDIGKKVNQISDTMSDSTLFTPILKVPMSSFPSKILLIFFGGRTAGYRSCMTSCRGQGLTVS
jgi:hypothetical protein